MTITWAFLPSFVPAPGVMESDSPTSVDLIVDVGVPLYYTEQDFLDMLDRLLPEWYLQPLKDQGQGYELLQSYAKMFERCSLAVGRSEDSFFLAYSSGGANSTASIEFYRPSLGSGVFTVKAGTVVVASKSNRAYVVVADVSFGAGDLFIPAVVESVGQGAEYDVPGPVVTADGTILPGEIDTIILPMTSPVFADPGLAVRQVADATGGSAPVLDQLGNDRGIERLTGEGDPTYKRRARQLPDTVSPAGIRRQLDAAFFSRNLVYDLIETWEHRYQSCWDAPPGDLVHPQQGLLREGTFVYDDPREDRFTGRWMGIDDAMSGYVLVVPRLPALEDRGMVWDDPAVDWHDQQTNYGKRAVSAWDAPIPDAPRYMAGAWDGPDIGGANFLHSVWSLFKRIKGAGVSVAFVLAGKDQTELAVPVTFPPLT